jgi:hypothetical protein
MDGQHFVSLTRSLRPYPTNGHLTAIHGDKQQNERDWVLNEFKTGKSPIMVATDVASRGIGMMNLRPPSPVHFTAIDPSPVFKSCDHDPWLCSLNMLANMICPGFSGLSLVLMPREPWTYLAV